MGNYNIWADDYGYGRKVNTKIDLLCKKGKLVGYSILATHLDNINSTHDTGKDILVGLHVNLVEGFPVSDPAEISSLIDKKGRFYPLWIFVARITLRLVKTKHLMKEINAQYKKLTNVGFEVSYIDSHQHTHALGIVHGSVEKIARKNNLTMRNYGNVRALTFRAKFMYAILRLAALLLPHNNNQFTAKTKNGLNWFFMTWETAGFKKNIKNMKNNDILVTHPGRNVDKRGIFEY